MSRINTSFSPFGWTARAPCAPVGRPAVYARPVVSAAATTRVGGVQTPRGYDPVAANANFGRDAGAAADPVPSRFVHESVETVHSGVEAFNTFIVGLEAGTKSAITHDPDALFPTLDHELLKGVGPVGEVVGLGLGVASGLTSEDRVRDTIAALCGSAGGYLVGGTAVESGVAAPFAAGAYYAGAKGGEFLCGGVVDGVRSINNYIFGSDDVGAAPPFSPKQWPDAPATHPDLSPGGSAFTGRAIDPLADVERRLGITPGRTSGVTLDDVENQLDAMKRPDASFDADAGGPGFVEF